MKISYEWLKRCINFNQTPAEVDADLVRLGLEVEEVVSRGVMASPLLVVGEVVEKTPHPDSDHMSVCKVDVGDGTLRQIVCGATNFEAGDRVPVAMIGCEMPEGFTIKKAKLRGVESEGMLCAADEIGLGGEHSGLLILTDNPEAKIGVPLHKIIPSDTVYELNILPNRPDARCHYGVARDLAAKWGLPLLPIPARNFEIPTGASKSFKGVTVEDPVGCPHYRAYTIKGVKIAPSPLWLQRCLESVGLRPISNVVDITNFILLHYGQPLHAFDLSKIGGGQIKVRRAKAGEKLQTLDGKLRELDESMLVIADAATPMVVAGIMGGEASGISDTTTDIVLEAAHFDQTLIRKTSRKLALFSDSSERYSQGIDPLGVERAAERAVSLILEIAGGTLDGAPCVVGAAPYKPLVIESSAEYLCGQLGFEVPVATIEKALTSFGFKLAAHSAGKWSVTVPSYRLDVEREVDLVEEVLRFIGVDKIPAKRLTISDVPGGWSPVYAASREMSKRLVALGYNECVHYSMRSQSEAQRLLGAEKAALHAVLNPLSADMSHLRSSLVPGLCDALALNASRGNLEGKFFETGHTFIVKGSKLFEQFSIAFVRRLTPAVETFVERTSADFFSARAILESLLTSIGLPFGEPDWSVIEKSMIWQGLHAARRGCILCGQPMLRAGLVNLEILKSAGVEGTVLAGEIVIPLEVLNATPREIPHYKPFSLFPSARRDIALVVDASASVGKTTDAVQAAASKAAEGKFALESVRLFDRYAGKGVAEGKVSLAYALSFRAMDRTLTDKEVNEAFAAAISSLKTSGYELRG